MPPWFVVAATKPLHSNFEFHTLETHPRFIPKKTTQLSNISSFRYTKRC
ncbi:hypothetical protein VITU102760_21595 [Vibrio tubiashii]